MKPNDIVIAGLVPLAGTLGRVEAEVVASVMVQIMAVRGNKWQPLMGVDLQQHLAALAAADSLPAWATDKAINPSPRYLINGGFMVEWPENQDELPDVPYEFTEAALVALKESRWYKPIVARYISLVMERDEKTGEDSPQREPYDDALDQLWKYMDAEQHAEAQAQLGAE